MAEPVAEEPVSPTDIPAIPAGSRPEYGTDGREKPPYLLIAAVGMAFAIIIFAALGFWLVSREGPTPRVGITKKQPPVTPSRIPVRVIDPLGGEDEDDLDDLIASWETEEDPLKAEDLKEISSVSETDSKKPSDLNVPIDFWRKQLDKALNHGGTGGEPAGLDPRAGRAFRPKCFKQKAKLSELIARKGYKQPLDFADLAELRLEGKFLGELPMATESYVLDIGGSVSGDEFTSFDFGIDGSRSVPRSRRIRPNINI